MAGALHKLAKKPKKWLQSAISHPGVVKAAAKRHGRTTLQEAKVEAHSKDRSIRSRGLLAERLIHGDLHKK